MEAQGIFRVLPSSLSLSSMNVFDLVEVNTPAHFEKALRKQKPEEALDCGAIFFLYTFEGTTQTPSKSQICPSPPMSVLMTS
eukprot:3808306-Rhodomonas_salina.1